MKEDFLKAMELINNRQNHPNIFTEYDRVYPYTTENINGYLEDLTGKSVLSVVGSGDHYLDLITMGAREVDCFDINKFALYYLRLKKASVKCLNKREYFDFLTNNSNKYFNEVKKYLDASSYLFWSYYVNKITPNTGIQDSYLFYPRNGGGDYIKRNIYLTNDGYNLLQEKIIDKHEDYYWGNIYTIANRLDKKYDSIYLSNICDYQEDLREYRDLIIKLRDNNLKDNGELYYAYYYGKKDLEVHFYYNEIDNSEIIEFDGIDHKTKDKVLRLKKRTK